MKIELTQNLWERFGFRDNPFDTRALSLSTGSLLSVAEAFVGRDLQSPESKLMTNFLRGSGGGRIVVEGDVGVGKTTFVNYHRYLWEHEAKTALLTPASEISVQGNWGARELLLSALGALAGRLALAMDQRAVEKDRLLTEVLALTGVLVREWISTTGGMSVLGFGGNLGRSKSVAIQRGDLSIGSLQDYLRRLLDRARRLGFAGVVIHLNNLELLARRHPVGLVSFFDEVRDILQEPRVYFIFVGYTGMFQEVIVPLERVRSIFFGTPIHLPPLKSAEVHQAIERRYKLLAIRPKRWIRPVDGLLIDYLYEIFSGKIRFIMDAISSLVTQLPEGMTGTLSTEAAQAFLTQLTWERVKNVLSPVEEQVLQMAVKQGRFTNTSLVKATGKSKQNVTKYLNRLLDLHFIHPAQRRGRHVYYEIAPDLALLRPQTRR